MSDRKPRIVIVEDEADVARYLAAALEDAGYEVHAASTAEEGFRLVSRLRPDLVCLDLVMPGRTGLSLYRELREEPSLSCIPIVVVSGVVAADAAEKLGLGDSLPPPDAFVEKPVNLQFLIETVGRLCPVRGTNS